MNELNSEREMTRVSEKFRMQNELLVRHFSGSISADESFWRIVVPDDQNTKLPSWLNYTLSPMLDTPDFNVHFKNRTGFLLERNDR